MALHPHIICCQQHITVFSFLPCQQVLHVCCSFLHRRERGQLATWSSVCVSVLGSALDVPLMCPLEVGRCLCEWAVASFSAAFNTRQPHYLYTYTVCATWCGGPSCSFALCCALSCCKYNHCWECCVTVWESVCVSVCVGCSLTQWVCLKTDSTWCGSSLPSNVSAHARQKPSASVCASVCVCELFAKTR